MDDAPILLGVLVAQLESEGLSVWAVDSGVAALQAAAVKTEPRTASSRVAHTTLTDVEVRSELSDYYAFLLTPCDIQQLRESIVGLVRASAPGVYPE